MATEDRSSTGDAAARVATGPPVGSRLAAAGALVVSVATLVAILVFAVHNLGHVIAALVGATLAISAFWVAATRHRWRLWAGVAAVILAAGAVVSLVAAHRSVAAVIVVVVGIVAAAALGGVALRWEVREALAERWRPVPAPLHPVLVMNPKSGGGKVTRFHLEDEARRRGVETVLLQQGDDLRALAEAAVARGADTLGMAGGDGSQAVVAGVAADHGVPYVCIPAGTRNHLALDLGIDRDDPLAAMDAFGPAREATIDLAEVNGQVFVNNVSLGLYARIVASDRYRDAKRQTVAEMLPDLIGPGAEPFGLRVDSPAGEVTDAQVIQVSNNPYTLSSLAGFGSRASIDTGALGVVTLSINRLSDVNRLVALEAAGHPERFEGWRQWTTSELEVRGPVSLDAAVDGEARRWAAPLRFAIRPGALRVRIAPGQPGASPAFLQARVSMSSLIGLLRLVRGRPSGIVGRQPDRRDETGRDQFLG